MPKMPKRFLNVEYSGTKTEVDFTTAERLGEVQDAIKTKYGDAIPVTAAFIQVYDQQGQHINNWALVNSLPDDYFVEGGSCLVVRTIPPASGELSTNHIVIAGSASFVMPKRFLNVEYAGIPTRITFTDMEDLSEVRRAIKTKYGDAIPVTAAFIQVYDQQGQHINKWALFNSLPDDYFVEGGSCLVVCTIPPPSGELSTNGIVIAGSGEEGLPRKRQRTEVKDLTKQLTSFANIRLVEGCIQCQDQAFCPYPQEEIEKVYVRKCYQDVFDLLIRHINPKRKAFAISGTSGIGKSLFFVYILYRLMNDFHTKTLSLKPNRVVYQLGIMFECFDLQQQLVTRITNFDAGDLVREQDTFYVIDGRSSEPLPSTCVVLFISSPRSEWYTSFVKHKMAKEWYFPVWTLDELQDCQRLCYPALSIETVQERYQVFGGVVRFIFYRDDTAVVLEQMDTALADVDAVKRVRNIGYPTKLFATSHMLLHAVVSKDGQYRFCYVDIASKYVGEQIWIRHSAEIITNMQKMFGGSPNEISRHLFEIYGHMVFSAGGRTLRCRCLESGTVGEITLDALNSERVTFGKRTIPTSEDLSGHYYEPTDDDNFPAIDSLSPQGMFQFTVAAEHPIRGVQILRRLCGLYHEPKLYFVVPPHRFAAFKKQFQSKNGQR